MITITFEDHGQDFIEWDIDKNKVVGCRPFQAWVWCGNKVLSKKLAVGKHIIIRTKHVPRLAIKYPIASIQKNTLPGATPATPKRKTPTDLATSH